MQTYRLIVGPDGRVTIPNARPGQTIIVQVNELLSPERLTLATATTPDEKAAVVERILDAAGQLRDRLKDDLPIGDVDLYDEDGLPA